MSPHVSSLVLLASFLGALSVAPLPAAEVIRRPNVLFISVDDLNDWVGAFSGNPQAVTPHLDRFAKQRDVISFQRAYCPGPVCGPSRSAYLSGFMPHRTGIYDNNSQMRNSALVQTHATLPEYFEKHGYHTLLRGKLFHQHFGDRPGTIDSGHWAFRTWTREAGQDRVDPAQATSRDRGLIRGRADPDKSFRATSGAGFNWGPILGPKEETRDFKTAHWAAEQLRDLPVEEPFFLVAGLHQPHLPWHLPKEYFDRHPLDTIRIPQHRLDDLDDIVDADGKPVSNPSTDFRWVSRDPELFKSAVQAYLAATTYADEMIGLILDALASSRHAGNTIVVIAGDHGWHLGEKLRFRKATLWAEATRTTLMIRAPGVAAGGDSRRLVNLIDLYPTLIELAGLPPKSADALDGRSLVPLLREPGRPWAETTLTVSEDGNAAAVIGERWYYIQRENGANELYDMETDPMQFTNLVRSPDPEHVAWRERLAAQAPRSYAPFVKRNPPGPKAGEPDPGIRATRDLSRLH